MAAGDARVGGPPFEAGTLDSASSADATTGATTSGVADDSVCIGAVATACSRRADADATNAEDPKIAAGALSLANIDTACGTVLLWVSSWATEAPCNRGSCSGSRTCRAGVGDGDGESMSRLECEAALKVAVSDRDDNAADTPIAVLPNNAAGAASLANADTAPPGSGGSFADITVGDEIALEVSRRDEAAEAPMARPPKSDTGAASLANADTSPNVLSAAAGSASAALRAPGALLLPRRLPRSAPSAASPASPSVCMGLTMENSLPSPPKVLAAASFAAASRVSRAFWRRRAMALRTQLAMTQSRNAPATLAPAMMAMGSG